MAKISSFKRIVKEDVSSDFQQLAEKFGYSVNPFAEDVVSAFNKNLTVDDNLNMNYKDITLSVNSSGVPRQTTQFRSGLSGKCRGITVERVENTTNSALFPTGAPFITFSENSGLITILHITGLIADNNYTIRVLAKG